jgi:hypothetical protein
MSPSLQCLTAERLADALIRQASRFIGLREVKPNAAWDNPKTPGPDAALVTILREAMRPTPWQDGWAYCAAFAEAAVRLALADLIVPREEREKFLAVHGPHVMTNVRAFQKRGLLSPFPARGALWLARHGMTASGHEGIVIDCEDGKRGKTVTIEANTSLDASSPVKEREGDWITTRVFPSEGRGRLKTQGFISPQAILTLLKSA